MPKQTTNLTRRDYQKEQAKKFYKSVEAMDDLDAQRVLGDPEEYAKETADSRIELEDERIWAFHRDPATDLTQVEARDRAQRAEYPERYQLSQSSVSRKLSNLDRDMLTEPIEHFNMEQRTDPEEDAGMMCPISYEQLKKNGFSDYLDTYRAMLARFMVDRFALKEFSSGGTVTPEWARDRFPELNPDLGRKNLKRMGEPESELHPPTKQAEAATSDD